MARVVLAMSGGVDSSVAAHLLLRAGHEVVGVFMRHGEESAATCAVDEPAQASDSGSGANDSGSGANDSGSGAHASGSGATASRSGANASRSGANASRSGANASRSGASLPVVTARKDHKQGCCTASDAADARRVAAAMKIPFYAVDLQADFARIVDYFVDDYLNGRTPNPCVRCNQWIKFDRLFDYADGVDAEFVATGHYAQLDASTRPPSLRRGMDDSKDQSYALFGIARHRLDRMLLPVGGFRKTEIREVAESLGLGVAGKKDSQEICFVTQGHHSDFVRAKEPTRSHGTGGEFVMTDGTVVGTHGGYEAFTVGQRKGLGIAMGRPVFVVRVEPQTRRVVLGDREDLLESGLIAGEANWLVDPHSIPENVHVQIRYNGRAHPARVSIDAADCQRFGVHFEQPESAVAPGQAAVVYDGDRVLGGGWIEAATGGL